MSYLHRCYQKGKLLRWPASLMPIKVFIGQKSFRTVQVRNNRYETVTSGHATSVHKAAVSSAIQLWAKALQGLATFQMVDAFLDSQINIHFKNDDIFNAASTGDCDEEGRIYSAEISVGISEGAFEKIFNHGYTRELEHLVAHEFGRVLGLGTSENPADVMYLPHQFGVLALSPADIQTVRELYGEAGNTPGNASRKTLIPPQQSAQNKKLSLQDQQDLLAQQGRMNIRFDKPERDPDES